MNVYCFYKWKILTKVSKPGTYTSSCQLSVIYTPPPPPHPSPLPSLHDALLICLLFIRAFMLDPLHVDLTSLMISLGIPCIPGGPIAVTDLIVMLLIIDSV